MNTPERSIGPLLAALCVRLAEADSPLNRDPELHAKVRDIIGAVRKGGDDLDRLFEELDAAMRRAGFPRGLEPARVRVTGSYRPLSALDVHAVHTVLRCPGDCPRIERSTPQTRLEPPNCQVHDRRMRVERRR